jgi:hypothetical protein
MSKYIVLPLSYAEKLNYYMKENTGLKSQLEDTKTTLILNKELLFKYISSQGGLGETAILINELRDENTRVTEKNNDLYNEKVTLEKKVRRLP